MRWSVLFIALVIALFVGCSPDEERPPGDSSAVVTEAAEDTPLASGDAPSSGSAPASDAPVAATEAAQVARSGTLYGIAGLIPPHFPDSTDADWLEFFRTLPSLGDAVGNYSQLSDLGRNQEVAGAVGIKVLPVTGFHQDVSGTLEVNVDFTDPVQRGAFIEGLERFAAEQQPEFLRVGNEVNRVWEVDEAAFDAWVAALPEIVEAVHAASPGTRVFATFQFEFLTGRDAIAGGKRTADWSPLEEAAPHLDLVAFTTYPYFDAESPADLPRRYYAEVREHTDRPVGITEMGWPSAAIEPLEGSPAAGLSGTQEEQVAFIERVPDLLGEIDPAFLMWVWAYDTAAVGPTFESLGLHDADGQAKPALEAWRSLAGR